jgi:hypothetical protein
MSVEMIIGALAQARQTTGTAWVPETLRAQWNLHGAWTISKKDVEPSRLPNESAPGESLVQWVTEYSHFGSPFDRIRVRYRGQKTDKTWFVQPPVAPESTGWDRALDILLPLLANEQSRAALANTIGKAFQPMIQTAVVPAVRATVIETLSEMLTEEEETATTDVNGTSNEHVLSGGSTDMAVPSGPSPARDVHLGREQPDGRCFRE